MVGPHSQCYGFRTVLGVDGPQGKRGWKEARRRITSRCSFEQLISNPRATLATFSGFIEQELDYDHILKVGIGSVSEPNTSFKDRPTADSILSAVGRRALLPEHLAMFEALVGTTLQELGYELGTTDRSLLNRADMRRMRAIYRRYFDSKLWLKAKTPLGKGLCHQRSFVAVESLPTIHGFRDWTR